MTNPGTAAESVTEPRCLVVVLGTATEVGKTWVTARLIEALVRRGMAVNVRKPVQSYDPACNDPTDAEVLGAATGENPDVVCAAGHGFGVAMAPPMAAEVLGLDIPTLGELVNRLHWSSAIDMGIVETVGGVRSPLAANGDSRDLAVALTPTDVVLVADAGLGTLDAVRTSTDALGPMDPVVYLNRYDPDDDLHRRNREWLTERDGIEVLVDIDALADRLADRLAGRPTDRG